MKFETYNPDLFKKEQEDWIEKQEEIIDNALRIGCSEKGLHMNRVYDFFNDLNLPFLGHVIFPNEDQLSQLERTIRKNTGFFNQSDARLGFSLPDVDITVVLRSEREKNNGTVFTESMAVHELAHATRTSSEYFQITNSFGNTETYASQSGFKSYSIAESGNTVIVRGSFFEEAFAEICRVRFLDLYPAEELQRMIGTRNLEETRKMSIGYVPSKFFYRNNKDEFVCGLPMYAAFGMEMLFEESAGFQELVDTRIKQSKENDVDVLKNLFSQKFGEELFENLNNLQYTKNDFLQGVDLIRNYMQSKAVVSGDIV